MRIAICGLIKSSNLGEEFIAKSLAWIISQELCELGIKEEPEYVYVDIQATNDITKQYPNLIQSRIHNLYGYTYRGIPADFLHLELKKVASKSKSKKLETKYTKLDIGYGSIL